MNIRKVERLIWLIFSGVGAILLIVGAIICILVFNYDNKIDTTGVITEISVQRDLGRERSRNKEQHYKVYVAYEVDGTAYESRLGSYSPSYYEGKEIDIYYDRDDPRKIGTKELNGLLLIVPGIGLLFFCMGVIGLVVFARKGRRGEALRENGYRVAAEYMETELNIHYSVNNRNPYRVVCRWRDPENGEMRIFKSDNLWENPEPMISARNVRTFSVYLDRKKPKRYVVDTDWLTSRIEELL